MSYVKGVISDLLQNKVDMSLLVVTKVGQGALGLEGVGGGEGQRWVRSQRRACAVWATNLNGICTAEHHND